MRLRSPIALAVALFALFAGACAQDVQDINRVQPNYVKKSNFDGVWYFRQAVIEVPYESSLGIVEGYESNLEKVRWEVTEKALIAYRTYEFAPGFNGDSAKDSKYDGAPVAAYAIQSHFDIQRGYNPATGEVNNVIGENSSDRPWWERDYMRVDWSSNLITNMGGLDTFMQIVGGSPANYWVPENELDNPDRAEIKANSINVVNKYNFSPDYYSCQYEFADWWVGYGAAANCSPNTVKMRLSFLRIDPNRPAYEPASYPYTQELTKEDGSPLYTITLCTTSDAQGACQKTTDFVCDDAFMAKMRQQFGDNTLQVTDFCERKSQDYWNRFGYFRTEKITYDRNYGPTETGRVYLANRWNLWKNALAVDDSGHAVPRPYAEREVKPIVYTLDDTFPEALKPAAYETAEGWNKVFRETVSALTGQEAPEHVFVIEDNRCTNAGIKSYLSKHPDLVSAAMEVVGALPKGLSLEQQLSAISDGSDEARPLVTESNRRRTCARLESASKDLPEAEQFTWQKTGDLRYSFLHWVNNPQAAGPLGLAQTGADPETGEVISANAHIYGAGLDTYAQSATDFVLALNGQLTTDSIISGAQVQQLVRQHQLERQQLEGMTLGEGFKKMLSERLARQGGTPEERFERATSGSANWGDARLSLIKGTALEKEKGLGEDILRLSPHYRPNEPVTADILGEASPATWASANKMTERKARQQKFLNPCLYQAEFADDSILGLALQYKAAGKSPTEIYNDLRARIFVAVALHEVGHTVGLRHNFEASTDALNYFDEFWDIQQQTSDPQKRAELQQPEYRYTSIMEYGAKFNSDVHGLGKYDLAAIKFGYGGLVELFDESVPAPTRERLDGLMRYVYDYSKLPTDKLLGSRENLKKRKTVSLADLNRQYLEGLQTNTNRLLTGSNLNKILVLNFTSSPPATTVNFAFKTPAEVPYRFCTDDWESYTPTCRRFDEGANQREVMASMAASYRNYYVWSAFKRDRFNFNPIGYMNGIFSRYFLRFVETFQEFYYSYAYWFGPELDSDYMQDMAAASLIGLNTLGSVFQTPEPGDYCEVVATEPDWSGRTLADQYQLHKTYQQYKGGYYPMSSSLWPQMCDRSNTQARVNVPLGVGRRFYIDWENIGGQMWRPITSGAYYDRLAALQALTWSRSQFAGARSSEDRRQWKISFYRLFAPEIVQLFGRVITDDLPQAAGGVQTAITGKREFKFAPLVDPAQYIDGQTPGSNALKPLMPRTSPDLRYYTTLFGMALFSDSIDQQMDFVRYMKVSLKGNGDDMTYEPEVVNDPTQYIEVTDPFAKYTYRAVQTWDGNGIAFELMRDTKALIEKFNAEKARLAGMSPADEAYGSQKRLVDLMGSDVSYQMEAIEDTRRFQAIFGNGN